MIPENEPERELSRERRSPVPEAKIQRLDPRPETQPVSAPASSPAPQPSRLSFQKLRRATAILLLLISGGVLIGGADEKQRPAPEPPAAISESIPDEIVVDLKDTITDAEITALGQSLGIELKYNSIHSVAAKLMVAKINPNDRGRLLTLLRASPLVEGAEPQFLYHVDQAAAPSNTFVPNDPDYRRQWHLSMIGMETAWTKSRGKGVTVAVVDTGTGGMTANGLVQAQDFDPARFVKGYNFADKQDLAPDDNGHGTHVSGTIAESTDNGVLGAGVAPEANIMSLRVADAKGALLLSSLTDAIRFAADHGANVINMSLSGPNYSQIAESAMTYAYKKNITLVCAAGNTGQQGVRYPAKYKECIAVSAAGPGAMIASYSTWGKELDIAGPGGDPTQGDSGMIWQNTFMQRRGFFGPSGPRVDSIFPLNGTSMAAPHVAGVAALLVSMGMTDPKEIRSQIRKSAKKYAPADHYGAGLLDAAKATESVQRATRYNWLQIGLAAGIGVLLLTIGRSLQKPTDPMFFVHKIAVALAVGLFFPVALEKLAGFGSYWNLLGHSVIVAILFLMLPRLDRSGFWQAFAFTFGIVIHLLLDADSGRAPFQVYPQQRILFWMYMNAAVGLYFCASAYRNARQVAMAGRA